jgi:hypothetical protein
MKHIIVIPFLLLVLSSASPSQGQVTPDTVRYLPGPRTVIPGPEYEAGWLHKLFYGSNWRDLWTSPMIAEVLDLNTFGGGLTPTKRGGGKQTISLKFTGPDGRKYTFRSLNKDARQTLPPELRQTIAGDFIQDQISSQNPVTPLLVSPLLKAVGIQHAEPRICILPKDPRLGEFLDEFGGMLGTIEEVPTGTRIDPEFDEGSDESISTFKLFHRLEHDGRERVDAREFLKARMMDIYLGDWDRHADQWRWTSQRSGDDLVWLPIPRDRDWAFAKFEGLIPWLAEESVPELKGFGDEYPEIEGLTWKGHHLDRWFLVGLEKTAWDSIAAYLQSRMPDSLIRAVVRSIPENMYASDGPWLESALILRRDNLKEVSDAFFRLCSKFADVRCTNDAERADVSFPDDRHVRLALYRNGDPTEGEPGHAVFDRTFEAGVTDEIRLYLNGGDDVVTVSGTGDPGISMRVIGGDGKDEVRNASGSRVAFFDSDENTMVSGTAPTSVNSNVYEEQTTDTGRYESRFRDYGHRWKSFPWVSINSDFGLFLGWSFTLNDYAFRAHPLNYSMRFRGGISSSPVRWRVDYLGRFYSIVDGAIVNLYLNTSQLETANFYGLGNETPYSKELNAGSYYRVFQKNNIAEPSIEFPTQKNYRFRFGAQVRYVRTDHTNATLLNETLPYGSADWFLLSKVLGEFTLDTRDRSVTTSSGVFLGLSYGFYPALFDNEEIFHKVHGELRTYLAFLPNSRAVLAMRVAGDKILGGRYPFFEAASVGGSSTLRGFDGNRFHGDASVYGNLELRTVVSGFSIILPGTFGVIAFTDGGRVYVEGESSSLWHYSFGGGLWFNFLSDQFVLNVTVGKSPERLGIYVGGGFVF